MENFLWQKTLLDMYNNFDRFIMIADNKFDRIVSKSLYCHGASLYEELMCLMARKNNCKIAKQLVEEALRLLTKQGNKILHYYYIDNLPFKTIAQMECINIRQIFRNFDKEIANFAYNLSKLGYSSDIIQKEFGTDSIFNSVYKKLDKKVNGKCAQTVLLPAEYCDDIVKTEFEIDYTSEVYQDV